MTRMMSERFVPVRVLVVLALLLPAGPLGWLATRSDAHSDPVSLAEPDERVGLLDAGPGGAAHAVGVEEDEDDVERAVTADAAHRRAHLVGECHLSLSPVRGGVAGAVAHDPRGRRCGR